MASWLSWAESMARLVSNVSLTSTHRCGSKPTPMLVSITARCGVTASGGSSAKLGTPAAQRAPKTSSAAFRWSTW